MSAFLLLGIGITFSVLLMLCEHCYFRYLRKYLAHFRNTAWCHLISIDVGQSLDQQRQQDQEYIQDETENLGLHEFFTESNVRI